jgi:hypothetical protein
MQVYIDESGCMGMKLGAGSSQFFWRGGGGIRGSRAKHGVLQSDPFFAARATRRTGI